MLVESVVILMIVQAFRKAGERGKMTPERKDLYENALQHLTDPEKLRKLADTFESHGLKIEATMLRKRADLRALPEDKKREHKAILEKARKSTNVDAILQVADAFDSITANGAAQSLRKRADELRRAQITPFDKPIEKVVPKPAESKPVIEVKAEIVEAAPGN